MQLLETTLVLIALVLVSSVLDHVIRPVPVALIQVGLGWLAALFLPFETQMNSEWFLLLFVAPLLYNDGRRFPKEELWNLRFPIVGNAILLVFITMLLGGWIIHLIIPSMPLAVGMALAAVLAPTDPVAVHSIAQQVKMPEKIMTVISGESLINDASGLIGFNYAVSAVVTGSIAWGYAALDFMYTALFGALLGLFLGRLFLSLRAWLDYLGVNDVIFNTVLKIALPFFIFFITEHFFHASGVIAVVVAGLVISIYEENAEAISVMPELRLISERTWDIITFTLNGIMFVLLGSVLPQATSSVIKSNSISTWSAMGYVVLMWLIMLVIRVGWTLLMQRLFRLDKSLPWFSRLYYALISGIAGVRGAITMAAVFTVPAVTAANTAFPSRSLVQFIAAGVVIFGLVVATIALPTLVGNKAALITRGSGVVEPADDADTVDELDYQRAKDELLRQTVAMLRANRSKKDALVIDRLLREYGRMLTEMNEMSDQVRQQIVALRCELLHKQVCELKRLKKTNQIHPSVYKQKRTHLWLVEQILRKPHQAWLWHLVIVVEQTLRQFFLGAVTFFTNYQDANRIQELRFVSRDLNRVALKYLSDLQKNNPVRYANEVIWQVKLHFRDTYEAQGMFKGQTSNQLRQREELWRLKATGFQRTTINNMVAKKQISVALAQELHRYVNHTEDAVFELDWAVDSI